MMFDRPTCPTCHASLAREHEAFDPPLPPVIGSGEDAAATEHERVVYCEHCDAVYVTRVTIDPAAARPLHLHSVQCFRGKRMAKHLRKLPGNAGIRFVAPGRKATA